MKIKKILIWCLGIAAVAVWIFRIIRINKNHEYTVVEAAFGESVETDKIRVSALSFGIDNKEDYLLKNNLSVTLPDYDTDIRIVWGRFKVTNISDSPIEWDVLFDKYMGWGFEADNWVGSVVPFYTSGANVVHGEIFMPGDDVEILLATSVTLINTSNKYLNKVMNNNYSFVVDVYPNRKILKLTQ